MNTNNPFFMAIVLLIGAAVLSSCNSSNSAVETKDNAQTQKAGAQTADQASTEQAGSDADTSQETEQSTSSPLDAANVINQPGKVQNRGGYIKILVNRSPITNFDIQRRAKFLQLRRVSGNRTKLAEKELIEQVLKLEEAKRRNVLANDQMVDQAFANFAQRNRASPAQMAGELNKLGVGSRHFKEFIRTQMSWQRAVQGRFRAETEQKSERDVVTQLRKSGSAKPEVTEYNLQQVIFVIPAAKRSQSLLAARKIEAQAFRQRFTSCEQSVNQAKELKDVSVVDRKRIMEPELPANWNEEIIQLNKNGLTRPKDTQRGVELMIVCDKRIVSDDRAAQVTSQSSDFESFNEQGSKIGEDYLQTLAERSTIIYR